MSTPRPILGIDLGSHTLAAAYCYPGEKPRALPITVRGNTSPVYPARLLVDGDGKVRRPDHTGTPTATVGNITRRIGQPPQVIAGEPYGINTLIDLLVAPALDAADNLADAPDTIAAVVPDHWPGDIIAKYRQALAVTGKNITIIYASEAIACYAELIPTDGIVTCVSVGAQAATLTLALPNGDTRCPATHEAAPRGGLNRLAQSVVVTTTAEVNPNYVPNTEWMDQAAAVGRKIIRAADKAQRADTHIAATLPGGQGRVKVPAGHINDFLEDQTRLHLRRLANNEEVHNLWGDDEEAGIPRKLLVAGGASLNTAVGRAIRAEVGPFRAERHPQAVLAMGAARLAARMGEG